MPTVTVANTPSVTVANTPSVSISGTPTVTLAPGGSTNVTNPLDDSHNAIPLAMTEGAQFLAETCTLDFSGAESGACQFAEVPPGKMLVVQEVDAMITIDTGMNPEWVAFNDGTVGHYLPATYMSTVSNAVDTYATHQATHMYVGFSNSPQCGLAAPHLVQVGELRCQISGFLIDHP